MNAPLVSLQQVSRFYDRGHVAALRDVSLSVARGEFVAVVGPSGSGKSTLLHVMCGLDRPTRGRVLFQDREPASTAEWTRIRARHIGFVFQAFHLLPTLTALENVEVPMFGVVPHAAQRRRRAEELLSRVGLADRTTHRPADLSGGERQRVAIARSLANTPLLVVADEPTGNLDSKTAAGIIQLFQAIHAQGEATVVVVTHNTEVAAYAGRRVEMVDGQIVARA